MAKRPSLRSADLVAAEVWAYSPPQEDLRSFLGKRQHFRGEEEERRSRRLELFSRFDSGIELDDEMWWSVTPEQLAVHTAERCRCDLLLDGFAGAGSNSIAFARTCGFVISSEIDATRAQAAKANAAVYGNEIVSRLDFIVGDFATLTSRQLRKGAFDLVFMAPPWGGPGYNAQEVFNLSYMGSNIVRFSLRAEQRDGAASQLFLWTRSCGLSQLVADPAVGHEGLLRVFALCCRPRTVPLLPLLQAAAVFHMRRGAAATGTCEGLDAAHASTHAAEESEHGTENQEAVGYSQAPLQLHVELALRRSRRDSSKTLLEGLDGHIDLEHAIAALRRVLSRAASMVRLSRDTDLCTKEDGPDMKRRRTASNENEGIRCKETSLRSAHELRWEAAEAAEEETRLLGLGDQQSPRDSLILCAVAQRAKVYEGDESPTDWRLLPVQCLWAASPLTKGCLKDPVFRLSRRLKAAPKGEEDAHLLKDSCDISTEGPLIDALSMSPVPCVCQQISSWQWRAVGVTAYFGHFTHLHRTGGLSTSSAEPRDDTRLTKSLLKSKKLQEEDVTYEHLLWFLQHRLEALLQDALSFTGLREPGTQDTPASAGVARESENSPSSQAPADLRATCTGSADGVPVPDEGESATQEPSPVKFTSVACFSRKVFVPCKGTTDRVCNCFYSVDAQEHGRGVRQGDWKTFANRLSAAASKKLAEIREACCCRKCISRRKPSLVVRESTRKCSWKSALWRECEKLVHTYLAGASGCTATLRLAIPRPLKASRKSKKQGPKLTLRADPVQPWLRAEFLRRLAEAYDSANWESTACEQERAQKTVENRPTSPSSDSLNTSEDDHRVEDSKRSCRKNQLWTAEEVLHWQFGCSMWCNSGLRMLVAQHLGQLMH